MKVKSAKLRTLVSLLAFYKYTDEKHRLNSTKLNELLRPYDLDGDKGVIRDTVKCLRNFGVNVGYKGFWGTAGYWIADRPLNDELLNKLVFAVSTNPLLSQKEAKEILSALKPLVTVYQEPMLDLTVDSDERNGLNPALYGVYEVTRRAIQKKQRVQYTVNQQEQLYTPKYLYQTNGRLYMVGYDHHQECPTAVDLNNVAEAKPMPRHSPDAVKRALSEIEQVTPQSLILRKANYSNL